MSNKILLSESERHAVAHAQYQVDRASPDNPEVCFDYELVASILTLIGRLTAAAAAEAVEQRQEGMAWIAHEAKLRTIERCAQWIMGYSDLTTSQKLNIAADLRALKEQT